MDVQYPGFGSIAINGKRYEHDVVIEAGLVRPRNKRPSRPQRAAAGHTPLSAAEDIPWSGARLVIGTGASGMLPVLPEVEEAAAARGVQLITMPTAAACALLQSVTDDETYAILHVTC